MDGYIECLLLRQLRGEKIIYNICRSIQALLLFVMIILIIWNYYYNIIITNIITLFVFGQHMHADYFFFHFVVQNLTH